MVLKLEYIVDAIKALQAAELVLTKDEFIPRSQAQTQCLIARAMLESAIGNEVIAVPEVQS
ncbi:hypothetical protein [Paraburkholderia unamae]|uniref:Uncharacterized protein n=1 Tax=Paraburkholderia unamae TaxID=219649 RepID=A0ABX5KJQ3_9BURK|nr:hypothetical protein [Paraburkholderia unamae]PVX77200.1 hypothetical protein C7402_115259 [Paraburkholderia unamae]